MKKFLGIVVLGLLFSGSAYAATFVGKPCSETNWIKPCYCSEESNYAKKKFCNFKMGIKKDDAMSYCAERAEEYAPELRKTMFKSCMKNEGF